MFKTNTSKLAFALPFALLLAACDRPEPAESASESMAESDDAGQYQDSAGDTAESASSAAGMQAAATLAPTEGNTASGLVQFQPVDGGLRVTADISGLSGGMHGFHVHENGDCSAPDATSAGGHFNPAGTEHGAPDSDAHHVGDLGNIEANDAGRATMQRDFAFLSLSGDYSIMGKAVVVHAGADDLQSQPSGAAGARVACGVIQAADAS